MTFLAKPKAVSAAVSGVRLNRQGCLRAGLMVAGLVATAAQAQSRPQITVDTGVVQGESRGDVLAFLGMPYAAPPVGPLRWRPPQAPAVWTGVRNGAGFGAACPQPKLFSAAWAQVGPTSEDCLFLNVWKPASALNHRLPVMVFIHGGGFTFGAAGVPLYDGAALARRGVVIVTMNYRLGRLGFFAHPALTQKGLKDQLGNYGIMDQIAALKWVHRNIAKFGGDPGNVTIFGESAGAGSVQLIMAAPDVDGLFAKAVSESGAGLESLPTLKDNEARGVKWTDQLGLHDVTADALRALPVAQVITATGFPMIDGRLVRHSPGQTFTRADERPVPFIIGSNSFEGSLYKTPASKEALGDNYAGLLSDYTRPGVNAAAAEVEMNGEVSAVEPSRYLADQHAKRAPTFVYYFDQVAMSERGKTPGAEHGGEVEYLFGNKPADQTWDDADKRVSKLMGDYWVRFAALGDVAVAGDPAWKSVTPTSQAFLVFDAATHMAEPSPLSLKTKALDLAGATPGWADDKN